MRKEKSKFEKKRERVIFTAFEQRRTNRREGEKLREREREGGKGGASGRWKEKNESMPEGTAFKCNLLQSRPKRRVSFVRPRNAHVCPSRSEHACSCTRIDSSSSSSFSGRMRGNRNGIYVRDNDTRRRIDRSNSKIRSVSIGSRIELLSIVPMFTVNDTPLSTLSLFPSLSLDRSFVFPMRRHVASVDPRGHTHTTFRLSFALFPSPPPPRFPSTSLPFPIARRECVLIRPRLLPFGSIRRRGGARWV